AFSVLEGSIQIGSLHMSWHPLAVEGVPEYVIVDRNRGWLHHIPFCAPELICISEAIRFVRDPRGRVHGKAGSLEPLILRGFDRIYHAGDRGQKVTHGDRLTPTL